MTIASTLKTRRNEKPEVRRQQILTAARKTLIEQHYAEVILDEVARRAGVAKGTLYLYFKDKEHLHAAVMEDLMDAMEARLASAIALVPEDPALKLRRVVEETLAFFDENEDFVMTCGGKTGSAGKKSNDMFKKRFLRHLKFLSTITRECIRKGYLREHDSFVGAHLIIALVRMFMVRRTLIGGKALRLYTDDLLEIYLRGLGRNSPNGAHP
jgi:TetR/AcrR family fatty acid metabolism transcriptional regulator